MAFNDDECLRRCAGRWLGALIASLPLWASYHLVSEPACAETLSQALTATYKTNPRLDAERARLRATDEDVARAKSGYRPDIRGAADVRYERQETKPASLQDGEAHPKSYDLTVTQPIFRGFRTLNQVREAEAFVRAGRETLRDAEQDVLLEAVSAYMEVVRAQAEVRLNEGQVEVLSRDLRATQDRFAVGEVTRTDVAQAQARRALAVSQLDAARGDLRTRRATYERIVGQPPSNLVEPSVPEQFLPKSVEEALAVSAREEPNLVAAIYAEQAARHRVDRTWGELLPEFRVQANYSKAFDPSPTTDEQEVTTVVGQLVVPIYQNGGEVHARVRQEKHTHISRLQEVERARTESQEGVVGAWSQLQAARARLESDLVQVEANRTALAGVREEERVGQRTVLDVLDAEQELLNSEVAVVRTKRDLIVNAYGTLAAIGRLNAQELGLSDQIYDPEAHYHDVRWKWWGISITYGDGRREYVDVRNTKDSRAPAK
jgi:outer membrane protein